MTREMQRTTFGPWPVEFDAAAASATYAHLSGPDASCCNSCASFGEVMRADVLPAEVTAFLQRVGVDPAKPQEVWGAPDSGFLAGWWIIVGQLPEGPWDGGPRGANFEPSPGFQCWLTDHVIRQSWPNTPDAPLLQLEFSWESPLLVELEQTAWPRPRA